MLRIFYLLLPYWIISFYLWTTLPPRLFAIAWFGTLYLLAGLFIVTKGRRILFVLFKDPWITLLIILSGLSYFWSVAPETTFASFRSLIVQYILIGYLAIAYSLRQIIGFISKVLCCTGLLSFAYLIFLPQIAVRESAGGGEGPWQGIFPHQSVLAGTMALALVSLLYMFLLERKTIRSNLSKLLMLVVGGICLYLLLFCGAKTALMGCLASFSILPFFFIKQIRGMGTRNLIFALLVYVFCVGIPLLYLFQEFIVVEILGKSPTLSGRSYLWEHLHSKILERPFGYGLNAFWFNDKLAEGTVTATGYTYGNSHSNYFDLLLGLGFPGAVLLFLSVVTAVRRMVILAFNYGSVEFRWALQVVIILLVASYSDVFIGFLAARTIGWFVFCIISIKSVLALEKVQAERVKESQYYSIYKSRHSQLN